MQEPSDVNPGDDIMVEGMLTSPEGTGIDKKEITLAATGIANLPTEIQLMLQEEMANLHLLFLVMHYVGLPRFFLVNHQ